ncbi:MAG: hypothetical protein Tsb002_18290 [Wenzhouxiangellaceae bacterium]
MKPIYDRIGINYSTRRCTDPKIAKQLYSHLEGATRIINIGAGAGSYEPESIPLVAVEPSSEMISQRKAGSHPVKQAFAETLPFEDKSFSHAMTVLSMHHWKNRAIAFDEINRVVSERFVAITWDPKAAPFWLTRDYFPEIYEMDQRIFPDLDEIENSFSAVEFHTLWIPGDCMDGFLAAFWKRPKAYLSDDVRRSISTFSKIENLSEGLRKLTDDLESGAWAENNQAIMDADSLDVGYRIISAKIRSS